MSGVAYVRALLRTRMTTRRRDPGEDPVEMLVLDDDAGHEPRVIAGMQAIREHAAVAANGDRAVGGLAHERGRAAQAAVLDAVLEDVETALVIHGELRRDAA